MAALTRPAQPEIGATQPQRHRGSGRDPDWATYARRNLIRPLAIEELLIYRTRGYGLSVRTIDMEMGWLLRAFQHGAAAWKSGRPAAANPHPPDSDIGVVWDNGWKHGATQGGDQAVPRRLPEKSPPG